MKLRDKILLLVYSLMAVGLYFVEGQGGKVVLLAFIIYTSSFIKNTNQFLVYMGVSIAITTIESSFAALAATLPLYINKNVIGSLKINTISIVLVLGLSFASYVFGQEPQMTTMIVYIMSLVVFIQLLNSDISEERFYIYNILTFIVLAGILLLEMRNGNLQIKFGRLAIGDNIREVADLIAIPAYSSFALAALSSKPFRYKLFYYIIGGISAFILLLTISKGALIATAVGIIMVYIVQGKISFNKILSFFALGIIIYGVYGQVSNMGDFHLDRLNDEYDGFSGRTDIWLLYFQELCRDMKSIIFGLGPGDLKRIFNWDMYAHSLFLDMLFSYGFAMAIMWIIVGVKIFKKIWNSRNAFSIGLFVFSCLLYATHGVVTNVMFYVLIGVSYSIANKTSKYECIK